MSAIDPSKTMIVLGESKSIRRTFLAAFAATCLLGGCDDTHKDRAWVLPRFQYEDTGGLLSITGSLMGDNVGYKFNTWKIICVDAEETCIVANVEEIGRDQLGEIEIGKWKVANRNAQTITLDANDPTSCGHPIIVINRVNKTVNYTNSPQNQGEDYCKNFNAFAGRKVAQTYAWQIGNPRQLWEK